MGAANVGAVLLTWHDLSHRSHRVLVAMAHMALDTGRPDAAPRRYWNGPGYLAEVLYGPAGVAGRDHRGEAIPTPSALRQVEKCLTELVRAGALVRVVKGAPGRRAEYEVVLTRPTETVGEHPTESVGNTRPERSASTTETVGPRNHRTHQEHDEDNPQLQHHVPARDASHRDDRHGLAPVSVGGAPDSYEAASAHLERTIGHGLAGDLAAHYLSQHPDEGYVAAVLHLAHDQGWRPS